MRKNEIDKFHAEAVERYKARKLLEVSMLDLEALPASSGVYFALDSEGKALYVGKSKNLRQRCDLGTHHKLPSSIKAGARKLGYMLVEESIVLDVEKQIIRTLQPSMNSILYRSSQSSASPRQGEGLARKSKAYRLVKQTIGIAQGVLDELDSLAEGRCSMPEMLRQVVARGIAIERRDRAVIANSKIQERMLEKNKN